MPDTLGAIRSRASEADPKTMILPTIPVVPTAPPGSHPPATETAAAAGSTRFRQSLEQFLSAAPADRTAPPADHRPAAAAEQHPVAVAKPDAAATGDTPERSRRPLEAATDGVHVTGLARIVETIEAPQAPSSDAPPSDAPPLDTPSLGAPPSAAGRPDDAVGSETWPMSTVAPGETTALTAIPAEENQTDPSEREPIPQAMGTAPADAPAAAVGRAPRILTGPVPTETVPTETVPTQAVAVTAATAALGTDALTGTRDGTDAGEVTVATDVTAVHSGRTRMDADAPDAAPAHGHAPPREHAWPLPTGPVVDHPSGARSEPAVPADGGGLRDTDGVSGSTIDTSPSIVSGPALAQTAAVSRTQPTAPAAAATVPEHAGPRRPAATVPGDGDPGAPPQADTGTRLSGGTPVEAAAIERADGAFRTEPTTPPVHTAAPASSAPLPSSAPAADSRPVPADPAAAGPSTSPAGARTGPGAAGTAPTDRSGPASTAASADRPAIPNASAPTSVPNTDERAAGPPVARPEARPDTVASPATGNGADGGTEAAVIDGGPVDGKAIADGPMADRPEADGAAGPPSPAAESAAAKGSAISGPGDPPPTDHAPGSPRPAGGAEAGHPSTSGDGADAAIVTGGTLQQADAASATDGKPRQSAAAALAALLGDPPTAPNGDLPTGQRAPAATPVNANTGNAGPPPTGGPVGEVAPLGPGGMNGPGVAATPAGPIAAVPVPQRGSDAARQPAPAVDGVAGAEAGSTASPAPAGAGDASALLSRHPTLAAQATPPRPAAPHVPLPADQVAVQIAKVAENGLDRIRLQLRPAELGRVEVQMEVGQDGRLHALITADRPDTLQTLQRDARLLEQALQNAGFDLGSGDLSFRQGGDRQDQGDERPSPSGSAQNDLPDDDRDTPSPLQPVQRLPVWQQGRLVGLDIRL